MPGKSKNRDASPRVYYRCFFVLTGNVTLVAKVYWRIVHY